MDINISPTDLLTMIGEKEVQIKVLNSHITKLDNEIKRLKDLHEPKDKSDAKDSKEISRTCTSK